MFAKLFQWAHPKDEEPPGVVMSTELNPRVTVHYGIPSTASILAFDPIQRLLAIATLDGRIKVIGGNNIEGLLTSPKPLKFKHLEFLQNQGFLVSISNENEIQVWDMEHRKIASVLKWDLNITAFSVIDGTSFMYIGDEYAMVSVLKYDPETATVVPLPYHVPGSFVADTTGFELPYRLSVVGILPQPCSQGNRVLIAYANGLIVLWDASENKPAWVRDTKDLMLKDITVIHIPKDGRDESSEDISTHEPVEKEISSLCWAATDGSVLAVGYVDGDILFWNLSSASLTKKDKQPGKLSGDVVKLQLSSGARRRPVVILHQSANRSRNNQGCQLLVYGGDEIGSEQVPTVLVLDWSSGIETLKCTGRVDLTLNGALVDTIFLPTTNTEANDIFLLLLINPGQLHFYDDACLFDLMSQQESKTSSSALQYRSVVTTVEPYLTIGKLCLVCIDAKASTALSEMVSDVKLQAADTLTKESTKWPLTGGVPIQLGSAEDYEVARLYIAGYSDGSVRIWDATYPSLQLMYALGSEVSSVNISGTTLPVSAVDFCSINLRVAIGNECGLVRLYELIGSSDEDSLHLVKETDNEVKTLHQEDGPRCRAIFSLLNSPVSTLQFANSGEKLAVGFECGKVAVLDISTLSVLFLTDCVSGSSSPVSSLAVKSFSDSNSLPSSLKDSESKCLNDSGNLVVFALTKNAHIFVIDGGTGNIITSNSVHPKESTAISMHIIEGNNSLPEQTAEEHSPKPSQDSEANNDLAQTNSCGGIAYFGRLMSFLLLLCCEDELHLYSLKSVIQNDSNVIKEMKLVNPCRWISTFKKDENECWLAVLYQTGVIEIRSLPDLVVVGESSILSILRWNYRTDMEKTMCYSERGQIVLVNGSEFAIVSLLTQENDFRIPESLPCLHDKALAAADATLCSSPIENKKQSGAPGIIGGFIKKGFKGGKVEQNVNVFEVYKKNIRHLESIFSREPSLEPEPIVIEDDRKVINLNIDDIHIGDWKPVSSSHKSNNDKKEKANEKKKLLEGGSATTDMKPQLRTPEDIKAQYRKTADVASAASLAKDKLLERQEKLEKLKLNSEELESGAQDFAAMAKELAKRQKNRKWWQL